MRQKKKSVFYKARVHKCEGCEANKLTRLIDWGSRLLWLCGKCRKRNRKAVLLRGRK